MSERQSPPQRSGRFGAAVVGIAVGGSLVGVVGWYLISNRGGAALDTSGFDMASAPDAPRAVAASAAQSAAPASSLGMLQADPGLRALSPGSSTPAPDKPAESGAAPAAGSGGKAAVAASFKEATIKNTQRMYDFGRRMEAKYPSLTQYGKDWNKYPDLKALKDQYWRDRDPVKFLYGVSKSDNFGKLFKQYANDPGVRAFVKEGVKEVPGELLGSAGELFRSDGVIKNLVGTVAKGLGMPDSMVGMLGGMDMAKPPSQGEILSGIMNNPDMQKAMQGQKAPAALGGQGLNSQALQGFPSQQQR